MSDIKYTVKLGSVEPRTFHKYENGRMVGYCYSIERDRDGREIGRTEPTRLGSLGWDDGSEFTESDYNNLIYGNDDATNLFDKIVSWLDKHLPY